MASRASDTRAIAVKAKRAQRSVLNANPALIPMAKRMATAFGNDDEEASIHGLASAFTYRSCQEALRFQLKLDHDPVHGKVGTGNGTNATEGRSKSNATEGRSKSNATEDRGKSNATEDRGKSNATENRNKSNATEDGKKSHVTEGISKISATKGRIMTGATKGRSNSAVDDKRARLMALLEQVVDVLLEKQV
ncbi:hypothetical protein QQS21_007564 [Conoideocrella luteorostrata]|uniref:Uncharacterized protein n=1 Tax=Conoideocrella luteorostrata TaxID=1105319 RepID=A0AAJ0CKL1_9HYPO|nr:hypothetical protein QQS21_007564 [Conoideocrella luteorostrata]